MPHLTRSEGLKRTQAIIAYCVTHPNLFNIDIAAVFNVTDSHIRGIMKRAGYKKRWVKI